METTSASLINRLASPQPAEQDWERFEFLYRPLLLFWAERRVGLSRSEAEDVAQDVMMLLMAKLPTFEYRAQGTFRGWLRTIMLNRCRDLHRKKKRDFENADSAVLRSAASELDEIELFSVEEYQQALARRALQLMQREFQESTWKACWLHVVENKSAAEISSELGITPNAVYLAKARVLKRLREELADLWDE